MRQDLGIKLKNGNLSGETTQCMLSLLLYPPVRAGNGNTNAMCILINGNFLASAVTCNDVEKSFKQILKILTKLSGREWGQGAGKQKLEL